VNLLHRYLFRELVFAATAAVVLFGVILLAGNAMKDLLTLIADGRLSLGRAASMVAMLVPFVFTYALPMGVITAILLTLGRLSAQNEITAMRTAGVGLTRIGAPVLLLAIGGVVISLLVNFEYGPRAKGEYRRLVSELGQSDPLSLVVPRQFIRGFSGFVIYVDRREGDVLHDVWVWKLDKQRTLEFVAHGDRGEVDYREQDNLLQLNLHNGWLQPDPLDLKGSFLPNPGGQIVPVAIPLSELFKRKVFQKKPSMLTFRELVEERERLRALPEPTTAEKKRRRDIEMTVHENAAMAFSVFSLALVGVPLGIQTRRTETSANLGLALLLTMIYYCLLVTATWLKDKPDFHAEYMLWLPNISFQMLGGWMWWRLGRN
jgi:lipopolysaccharide export system permease protein